MSMQKKNYIAAAVLAVFLGTMLAGCGQTDTEAYAPDNLVTARASEIVRAVPDMASVSLAVQTQGDTPQTAQEENSQTVDDLVQWLNEFGLSPEQIQTADYRLDAQYDYSGDTSKIVGYQMETSLEITGVNLDQVAELVGECVAQGANRIQEIRYECSQYDELYQQALQQAVKAAGVKAQAMAEAGESKLGKVVSITEYPSDDSVRGVSQNLAMEASTAMDTGKLAVSPGEVEIEAQVEVAYQVK